MGLIAVLVVLAAAIALVTRKASPRGGDEVAALCRQWGVREDGDARRLVERYLGRAARGRTAWAAIGVALCLIITLGWPARARRVSFGLGAWPPTSELVLMGLGGWFVGMLRVELFRLRPAAHGRRGASLAPRQVGRYVPLGLRRHNKALASIGVVAITLALPGLSASIGGMAAGRATALAVLAGLALLAVALGEICQRAITLRPRPMVSDQLAVADDAVRTIAANSVGLGAGGLAALLVGNELCLIVAEWPSQGAHLAVVLRGALGAVGLGLTFWSVALALSARRTLQAPRASRGVRVLGTPPSVGP